MTATRKERETTVATAPSVSKALTDRIRADGEQVSHTLDPEREPDAVRYPDPQSPNERDDEQSVSPQSNAEVQMARRTDAGPKAAATGASSADRSMLLLWVSGAVAVFLVIAVLISL